MTKLLHIHVSELIYLVYKHSYILIFNVICFAHNTKSELGQTNNISNEAHVYINSIYIRVCMLYETKCIPNQFRMQTKALTSI